MTRVSVHKCYCGLLFLSLLLLAGLAEGAIGPRGYGARFGRAPLLERFAWRILDWNYPSEISRQQALASGDFQPENALPVGVEIWRDKLFVTVPRWKNGIPATLNYIPLDAVRGGSPKLTPYPSWAQNVAGACGTGLTTVYRIHADACDRLWVLDVGTVGIGNTTVQACPYTINVFDLTTDKLIRQYRLRPEDVNQNTFIANIAVDLGKGGCDDAFAYMSDELGYGLIVYSWQLNRSWRVYHSYFMPDPLAGDYNIAGLNFQWGEEGIFGMSLSPIALDGFRTLFFHPLSSNREFAISTRILRDERLAEDSWHDFQVLPERGPLSHSTAEVMDENGLQFFNLIDQNAVGCWNSLLPYAPANQAVVARHDEAMIFPADVKVNRGLLWIMTDRMPVFLESTLNYTDVNFRILTVPVRDAIAGTVCDNSPWTYSGNQLWWDR
ncbi:protein yellow-like [Copidosoma floridanum]|uniref:protein yellow-like n=1 Tax=Copidosoma floridanum TaxID=29053 RepID=UPI0006C9ADCE|nr:protein yellow-like [Copidosoma floridanum]